MAEASVGTPGAAQVQAQPGVDRLGLGPLGAGRSRAARLGVVLERIPSADRLTIASLLLVVAVVSIPLLRTHALRQNELDALRTLAALSAPLHGTAQAGPRPATLGQLLAGHPGLLRRLSDAELLDEGRLLRRHGYLFDLAPAHGPGKAAEPVLRAWPWSYGRTGLGAFLLERPGEVLGHPNRGSSWSGLAAPPRPIPGRLEGWRRLRLSPER